MNKYRFAVFIMTAALTGIVSATEFHDDFSSGKLGRRQNAWPANAWKIQDGILENTSFSGGGITPKTTVDDGDTLSFRLLRGMDSDSDHHCGVKMYDANGKMTLLLIRSNFRYVSPGVTGEHVIGSPKIRLEYDRWYRIDLKFEPAQAVLLVDGKRFGEIPAAGIRRIQFYSLNQQIKIDDVKLAAPAVKRTFTRCRANASGRDSRRDFG